MKAAHAAAPVPLRRHVHPVPYQTAGQRRPEAALNCNARPGYDFMSRFRLACRMSLELKNSG